MWKMAEWWITANLLCAHLSSWNYYNFLRRPCKFISVILSVNYKISYKIVKFTYNIIPDRLGTPMVGLQGSSNFLKGHPDRDDFFLSLKRSDSILITSPFALRPLCWGFWRRQQGNGLFFSVYCLLQPQIKYQERSRMESELDELNGFFIIFKE